MNFFEKLKSKFSRKTPPPLPGSSPRAVSRSAAWEKIEKSFKSKGLRFYVTFLTLLGSAYYLADLPPLLIEKFIPAPVSKPTSSFRSDGGATRQKTISEYDSIVKRNLFSSKGLMPDDEARPTGDGPASRTSMPFNLVGTLILRDELKSIATIEDKTDASVYPLRINDEIPEKARILKVEARKVIFINLQSGIKEFVDLPEDPALATISVTTAPNSAYNVERSGNNHFALNRDDVKKAKGDLNSLLTQARAVPNFKNGAPHGYKLFQIVPGSLFSKLGIQDEDVIIGADGEPMTDPTKAFALLGELENKSRIELQIERGGQPMTFTYDIR